MNVNFRMDNELVRLARERAEQEGVTLSGLLRQALLVYLARARA